MLSPAARNSMMVCAVMRVPRTVGRPLQMFGSITIRSYMPSGYGLRHTPRLCPYGAPARSITKDRAQMLELITLLQHEYLDRT
ncbi:hypothetical protein ACFSC4_19615 [Deinococcus malanensis]|uniref:hypothetical protein n=1 Tax=Deinococcus malanensis TaxID=1706855 RepID=UPI003644FFC0